MSCQSGGVGIQCLAIMNKTVHIKSFGCQMNKLDTNLVAGAFARAGFEPVNEAEGADVVLINTCSVRQHAERKVFSLLGHLKHQKESEPGMVVAVFGCMAQRLKSELAEHEAVNIVCGPSQIPQLVELVAQAITEKKDCISVTENIRDKVDRRQSEALDDFESTFDSAQKETPGQAFVRVMRGCNNFCSYCIVPYVRGPEVSRTAEAIVEQIKKLADSGAKQITLLGQTVNSYDDGSRRLAGLLEMVSEIDGIEWIRFITSHPKSFDDSIFRAMADLPKVCKYLHVPAQSGSDRILKAMNRGYTSVEYLELLDKARKIVPGIAIAGDFIVGFDGETEDDFAATVGLVKKAQYKNCFVFKYSPRPGTRAIAKSVETVSEEEKKRRNVELLAVQEKISAELNESFLGQTVEVLVEGLSKKPHLNSLENGGHPQLIGRTGTDYIVVFNGPGTLAGSFVKTKIIKTSALTLFGVL